MSLKRRQFINNVGKISLGGLLFPSLPAYPFESILNKTLPHSGKNVLVQDEEFWGSIRDQFSLRNEKIHLNNGNINPYPNIVQDSLDTITRACNQGPAYYMRRKYYKQRNQVREKLAQIAGTKPSEIALVRNTTEALNTLLLGIDLKKNDRVLTTDQDYPSMLNTLKMRQLRDKIKIDFVKLPIPAVGDEAIVKLFENAIHRKTKVILVCHIISTTGQVLPIKKIVEMAGVYNIKVIVDGAHSFGHIDFKIPDLACDYYGTSLHKWMNGPFGSGMMYIKEDKISDIWPLNGSPLDEAGISKFEHPGTISTPTELTIETALDFHLSIGIQNKESRLRYLTDYWVNQIKDHPKIIFNTSFGDRNYGAISNFQIKGLDSQLLYKKLMSDYQIHIARYHIGDMDGIRVSPGIFTSLTDLDTLTDVILKLAD